MSDVFKTKEFSTLLDTLMTNVSEGRMFTPPIKDIFKSFDLCELKDVRVIFINKAPSSNKDENDGLAFSKGINAFKDALKKGDDTFYHSSLEHLPEKEGVMLLNVTATCPIAMEPYHHQHQWNPVTVELIKAVELVTNKVIWVFVGEETEQFGKLIGPNHYKFFIPELSNDWDHLNVFNKINIILEKQDGLHVKW